jgi:tetratricopeptide (TPR) repeat protein
MPDTNRQLALKELRHRIDVLSKSPPFFNQSMMTERAVKAKLLCNDDLFNLISPHQAQELWQETIQLFRRVVAESYPPGFADALEQVRNKRLEGLPVIVQFLEDDPWFFRSGYMKSELLRMVARMPLSDEYKIRLRRVVLGAIDLRDRYEFWGYCKLAKAVRGDEFKKQIEKRLANKDEGIRRRARWVLGAITHGVYFHIKRGQRKYKLEQYRDAIGDFNRAIKLEPSSAIAYFWRGKAHSKSELTYMKAIEDFGTSIELNKDSSNGEHYFWRARTYDLLGQEALAAADYDAARAAGFVQQ